MFDRELAYFKSHQDELVKRYPGRFLVIRGERVEADFPDALQAYLYGRERFEAGTYMIQRAVAGPEAYTVTIFTPLPAGEEEITNSEELARRGSVSDEDAWWIGDATSPQDAKYLRSPSSPDTPLQAVIRFRDAMLEPRPRR